MFIDVIGSGWRRRWLAASVVWLVGMLGLAHADSVPPPPHSAAALRHNASFLHGYAQEFRKAHGEKRRITDKAYLSRVRQYVDQACEMAKALDRWDETLPGAAKSAYYQCRSSDSSTGASKGCFAKIEADLGFGGHAAYGMFADELDASGLALEILAGCLDVAPRAQQQAELEAQAREREKQREEQERLAKQERERQEQERKQREEQERKRQEEERKRQEEVRKRQEEDKQRVADERAKRDERRRRDAEERARQARVAEEQRQRRIAQGFQDLKAAQDTNRKMGESSAAVAGAVFAMQGGNEGTEATKRAFLMGFGFGGKFMPHMSNTRGSDVVEESTTDTGGGFAFDLSLDFWPRYLKKWGVGIGGGGGLAGMALPGGAMYALDVGLGVKGYYGNRSRWTIRGEIDFGARLVGSSANLFGAIVSGSGSYSLWRFGVGPSFCKTASKAGFCETSFYALLFLDFTSIVSSDLGAMRADTEGTRSGKIVRLGAISKYMPYGMGLEIDVGFGYPAPGETDYPIQSGDEDRAGTYFGFSLRKAWAWHSGGKKR